MSTNQVTDYNGPFDFQCGCGQSFTHAHAPAACPSCQNVCAPGGGEARAKASSRWQSAAIILCVLIGVGAFALSWPLGRMVGRALGDFLAALVGLAVMGAIGYGAFALGLWTLTGRRPMAWLPVRLFRRRKGRT